MNLDKLFDISVAKAAAMPPFVMLPGIVDTHVHFRLDTDGRMQMVTTACAKHYAAVVDIPNVPNAQTGTQCQSRLKVIDSHKPAGSKMQMLITPLVNDNTDPSMIMDAWDRPREERQIHGIKIFWQGVSNDYGNSISSAAAIEKLIRATANYKHGRRSMPVTIHAECVSDYNGNKLPIKDREYWCLINEVAKLISYNRRGCYIIRHVSDHRTLKWIEQQRALGIDIHAEVSPQYLILIDDDIFTSDAGHAVLQCSCVFWPRPKSKQSQNGIRKFVLRGLPWIHFGLDFAMHLDDPSQETGVKINKWGDAVGGLNFLPEVAISVIIDFFASKDKLELLPDFISGNAAKLYEINLPAQDSKYVREDWVVPDYTMGEVYDSKARCNRQVKALNFLRGKTMRWKLAA